MVTPLLIAAGGVLVVYGFRVPRRLDRSAPRAASAVRRVSPALVLVVVAVSLFWTTATVAQWSGCGLAMARARSLDQLPSVIVDTKERLFLRSPGIEETALPAAPGQTFRYRYRACSSSSRTSSRSGASAKPGCGSHPGARPLTWWERC
ncbi:hypothetical protein [Amycolatopsis sp. DSM 110486]|uniref:hypothetical protein n=1 Tax=Amycolatopsis sp. DSM 110486 TaxID=2865832 RepID=UPI001C6A1EEA|nr:hypothetical protein [Amycolatopsis sp. DSM 110486]QYN18264.1 hypothetical protein K1T34_36755 [Amycolatopsis sp. DSM 110486]